LKDLHTKNAIISTKRLFFQFGSMDNSGLHPKNTI